MTNDVPKNQCDDQQRNVSDQRGTANSSILISWDLGMGLGILLGGVVAEGLGFTAAFHIVALMQLAGALLFIFATRAFVLLRRLPDN